MSYTIIPYCPVCRSVNQADRRAWDYYQTDEFACRICHTVWYQDPKAPLERFVLVRGKVPEPKAPEPAPWWVKVWRWFVEVK